MQDQNTNNNIVVKKKKKTLTRLHIHPLDPAISSKKTLEIRLPCIKFNVAAKDGLHIPQVPKIKFFNPLKKSMWKKKE
jgi:hypothetical protein